MNNHVQDEKEFILGWEEWVALPSIDVPEVSMPSLPTEPMGPIQMLQRNVQSEIRQRARENPAVAATLLGGLGNAGLL